MLAGVRFFHFYQIVTNEAAVFVSPREKVDKKFIDACMYVKDRMEEVSSPDKEMVRTFLFLLLSKKGETRMLMFLIGPSIDPPPRKCKH